MISNSKVNRRPGPPCAPSSFIWSVADLLRGEMVRTTPGLDRTRTPQCFARSHRTKIERLRSKIRKFGLERQRIVALTRGNAARIFATGTYPTETVGLELRNVVANYLFERSHRFPAIQRKSGHRDYSRLSCGVGICSSGLGMVGQSLGWGLISEVVADWTAKSIRLNHRPLLRYRRWLCGHDIVGQCAFSFLLHRSYSQQSRPSLRPLRLGRGHPTDQSS